MNPEPVVRICLGCRHPKRLHQERISDDTYKCYVRDCPCKHYVSTKVSKFMIDHMDRMHKRR